MFSGWNHKNWDPVSWQVCHINKVPFLLMGQKCPAAWSAWVLIVLSSVFSSTELKALLSFSDRQLYVICPSVCPVGPISTKFGFKWVTGIQVYMHKWGPFPVACSNGRTYHSREYALTTHKNLLLDNSTNFNQTCHKTSMGEGDSCYLTEEHT